MPHADPTDAVVISSGDAEPLPWSDVRDHLAAANTSWITSIHPTGRPHVRPVFTVWVDSTLHTTSGADVRKGRNLAADGRCSISTSADGMDLVVEGVARRVTDTAHMERIRDAYADKYGWPITIAGDAFEAPFAAPTAGPGPYEPWEIVPETVFAFGTSEEVDYCVTRFRF
jgi:hypothetical protein